MSDDEPPKEFQAGYYKFHPTAAPSGYYLSTGLPGCTCPRRAPAAEVPITADKNGEVWQVVGGNDKFTLLGKPIPDQYNWVVKDNVLFASLRDTATVFKIDSAGTDFPGNQVWHIGIPDQNVLLTYNGEANPPQLTFERANGLETQLFQAIPSPAPKRRN